MKKFILSVVAISMVSITALSAQEFKWGVKAGMNISSIGEDISSIYETSPRFGYVAGLMAEYKFKKDGISLSAEVLYSAQGNRMEGSSNINSSNVYLVDEEVTVTDNWKSSEDIKQDLGYINIPILFNFYPTEKLALKVGVQPAILLHAKNTLVEKKSSYTYANYSGTTTSSLVNGELVYESSSSYTRVTKDKSKDKYNTFDISIPIGLSYDIIDEVVVDARYNIGLSEMKNHVFQLTVGYKF